MKYTTAPAHLGALTQRLSNLEGSSTLALRRRTAMALVVVGQMLPAGAIKGGSAMALRYGTATRFTRDLDAARNQSLEAFREAFEETLAAGWAGFTGRLVARDAPKPPRVPSAYVMQPFDVRLAYLSKSWCTVKFELGHNELGDADEPEYLLASELSALFVELGLPEPEPVAVMRADHQIAQKLHAVSSPQNERAHDLVDLQLLDAGEDLDLVQVLATCEALFHYRKQQTWPPLITPTETWSSLYEVAAEDLAVLPDVVAASKWANELVARIATAQ